MNLCIRTWTCSKKDRWFFTNRYGALNNSAPKRSKAWKTGTALNLLQDLMIRIRDRDAYAKVTDCCGDGYMIGFTMKQGNLSGEGDG